MSRSEELGYQFPNSAQFQCQCKGPIRQIDDSHVEHACALKYAHGTSYYDGVQRFMPYRRVQINPQLTGGLVKFNWFLNWQS